MQAKALVSDQLHVADSQQNADEQNHKKRVIGKGSREGKKRLIEIGEIDCRVEGDGQQEAGTDNQEHAVEQKSTDQDDVRVGIQGLLCGPIQRECHDSCG